MSFIKLPVHVVKCAMSGKCPPTLVLSLGSTKKKEPVFKHVKSCEGNAKDFTDKNIKFLASMTKGAFHLAIMEALFIRELHPFMNVRDEYRDHKLSIKF